MATACALWQGHSPWVWTLRSFSSDERCFMSHFWWSQNIQCWFISPRRVGLALSSGTAFFNLWRYSTAEQQSLSQLPRLFMGHPWRLGRMSYGSQVGKRSTKSHPWDVERPLNTHRASVWTYCQLWAHVLVQASPPTYTHGARVRPNWMVTAHAPQWKL